MALTRDDGLDFKCGDAMKGRVAGRYRVRLQGSAPPWANKCMDGSLQGWSLRERSNPDVGAQSNCPNQKYVAPLEEICAFASQRNGKHSLRRRPFILIALRMVEDRRAPVWSLLHRSEEADRLKTECDRAIVTYLVRCVAEERV